MTAVSVFGQATGAFEPVEDLFARAVAAQGGSASLAIIHDGRLVLDLVGGERRPDALQLLFSVTKPVTAVVALRLHERGELDLDQPLAEFWPEFSKPSTARITSRMVLQHRSGIASLDQTLSLPQLLAGEDDAAVGAQEPYWEPDTDHGYHAFTFGTLMRGVFRRVLDRSTTELVAHEMGVPDLWIGAPQHVRHRIAPIHRVPSTSTPLMESVREASAIPGSSTARLAATSDLYNDPRLPDADWPSTGGFATAQALAQFGAATIDGSLLSAPALANLTAVRSRGVDRVLGVPIALGTGVQRPFPQLPLLGPASFGHEGAGGSILAIDPETAISVAWTTDTYPALPGASPVALGLLAAIRHCIETPRGL
ncbi:serine hydrolase domain-containing protein [Microbacterium sp. NPDC058389]|uniref:serine hydrolase domain-containing protein n=1 Tax=Microbacterium sp. NPDC058389 TaxID=3346475 RepID=UPI003663020C